MLRKFVLALAATLIAFSAHATRNISIAVLVTPAAQAYFTANGLTNQPQWYIDRLNEYLVWSQMDLTVSLAGTANVTPPGTVTNVKNASAWAARSLAVGAARDSISGGADVTIVLTNVSPGSPPDGPLEGAEAHIKGASIPANLAASVAVVQVDTVTTRAAVFAHEWGHLMGADHTKQSGDPAGNFYGHSWTRGTDSTHCRVSADLMGYTTANRTVTNQCSNGWAAITSSNGWTVPASCDADSMCKSLIDHHYADGAFVGYTAFTPPFVGTLNGSGSGRTCDAFATHSSLGYISAGPFATLSDPGTYAVNTTFTCQTNIKLVLAFSNPNVNDIYGDPIGTTDANSSAAIVANAESVYLWHLLSQSRFLKGIRAIFTNKPPQ